MTASRNDLKTADLARATDETRGRADERIEGRGDSRQPDERRPVPPDHQLHQTAGERRGGEHARTVVSGADILIPANEAQTLRTRWSDVQTAFVDEPRQAVERADALVAEVMKRLAEVFAGERTALEKQWDRGDKVTTEDLRVALQRYRAFFDRLLSV